MRTKNLDQAFLKRVAEDGYKRGYPFVTISREAGAGGHALAEAIKVQTDERSYANDYAGWTVFDKEIGEAVARDPQVSVNMQELLAEEYDSAIVDFFREIGSKHTSQYTIAVRTFEVVRTVATFGKVIIVGRAGALVTHDFSAGIHLRLVASIENRVQRMSDLFSVSEEEATHMIHKQDRDRARLVDNFFNRDITDSSLYDAVWNTDEHSIEDLAVKTIDLIEARRKELATT